MTAEDELRKVGEDVRELARALRAELRAASQQARARREAHGTGPYWFPRPPSAPNRYRFGAEGPGPFTPPPWKPRARPAKRRRRRHDHPPVRHRRDGSTLLSILLVVVGLAWLGSESGVLHISAETVLAAVLVVLGTAMVLTARTDWALSRRLWPVALGGLIVVMLLAIGSADTISSRLSALQFGPQSRTLSTWSDAATSIDNFAGPVQIDLTNLNPRPGDPDESMHISAVAGPVGITVPAHPGFRIHLTAQSAFGPIHIVPDDLGSRRFATRTVDLGAGRSPTLTVDVMAKAGPITIRELGS